MPALRNTRSKWLASVLASALVLTVALSYEPAMAGAVSPDEQVKTAFINVPLGDIEEGQWCVAYANVYNASAPYQYQWSGSYFWGTTQVVGANMWGVGGYIDLRVIDSAGDTIDADRVYPNVGDYDYNDECEA